MRTPMSAIMWMMLLAYMEPNEALRSCVPKHGCISAHPTCALLLVLMFSCLYLFMYVSTLHAK